MATANRVQVCDLCAESAIVGPERYRLLASAIAGRRVEVTTGAPNEAAWTDGSSIFIDPAAESGLKLASLAVQAALLGAGSLVPHVTADLTRRPALRRRYLAIEGHRALQMHEALLPPPVRRLVDLELAGRANSPEASLELAAGRDHIDDAPPVFGTIRPRLVRTLSEDPDQSRGAMQHVPRRDAKSELSMLDSENDEVAPLIDVFSSPVSGGGGLGRLLRKVFGDTRFQGSGPPGADTPTRWSRRSTHAARAVALSTSMVGVSDLAMTGHCQTATYPEWDLHTRRYKLEWCTVQEVEPDLSELSAFVRPDTQALRRALGRLGMEFERRHRQLQGDDVDIDATVEAFVDLEAGSFPDEAVYVDSVRRRRDLSVLLLLDISGSAGELSATGVPVHAHQRLAAGALAVALHELGDRVALYGFRSQGRSAVHVVPVKRFGEDLDTLVLERLGGLVPGAYTRLGAAMRHGSAILERGAGTARRLLVVLSDGFVYDHGYERAYGEADALRALAETRRRGIGCLCLSIGADTDVEALRRVFGTAAHATIPRVELLPTVVGPLFRAALRSAELQHGVLRRRARALEHLGIERGTA